MSFDTGDDWQYPLFAALNSGQFNPRLRNNLSTEVIRPREHRDEILRTHADGEQRSIGCCYVIAQRCHFYLLRISFSSSDPHAKAYSLGCAHKQ